MEGADRADRTSLPQDQQQGWSAARPAGDDAADPSAAAGVRPERSAMEDALIEVATMRRFAGIALITDRIPDENTILTLRHLLEKHDFGGQIFEAVKAHLKANGMATKPITILGATIINAPSSVHQGVIRSLLRDSSE